MALKDGGTAFSLDDGAALRQIKPNNTNSAIPYQRKSKTPRVATANTCSRKLTAGFSSFIAVVAEGKNREIGICGLDIAAPHEMFLSHMVDSHNFVETISLLDSYQVIDAESS
jgi:hypothetical protein